MLAWGLKHSLIWWWTKDTDIKLLLTTSQPVDMACLEQAYYYFLTVYE